MDELKRLDGALIITGHFGNWELMGVSLSYLLGDVAFLVGRQSNSLVDDFVNSMRSSHGIDLYNRRAAVKGVLTSVRRGGYVCWLSDQDAGTSGITVDFFGYPASLKTASIANAQPGTFEASFITAVFPAISPGAANRNTCQKGKFQGIIANTGPRGSKPYGV